MAEKKSSGAGIWIIVAAILGLLLGCLFGAFFAGFAGYAIGRTAQVSPPAAPFDPRPVPPDPLPREPETMYGALVTQIVDESPADEAGLQVGDIIRSFDQTPLPEGQLADVIGRYEPGDQVELGILRRGRSISVEMTLGDHPDMPGRAWMGIYYQALPPGRFDRP